MGRKGEKKLFFPRRGKEGETWQVDFVGARIGHFQIKTSSLGGRVYKLSSLCDEDTKSGPGGWGNAASQRAILLPVVS